MTGTQGSGIPAGIGADSGFWKDQSLDRDSGDPGLPARTWRRVPLGRYSGCQQRRPRKKLARRPGSFRFLEVVSACRGELECQLEEEEAEHWQVPALRRAVVGHRPVVYLGARGLHPTGRIHGSQVQQKYGKCASAKINAGDPENSVWREMCQCAVFHASTMRVEDAK